MPGLIEVFVAFGTLAVGWFLARSREREKDRQDKRLQVYAEILSVMALVERTEFTGLSERLLQGETLQGEEGMFVNNVIERFNEAHLNLMVYGSKDVIRAVSDHFETDAAPLTEESKAGYTHILTAMREDGFQKLYPELANDIDNILISGPVRRRAEKLHKFAEAKRTVL